MSYRFLIKQFFRWVNLYGAPCIHYIILYMLYLYKLVMLSLSNDQSITSLMLNIVTTDALRRFLNYMMSIEIIYKAGIGGAA